MLGPDQTPWVTTEEAARSPELALLSAMAHLPTLDHWFRRAAKLESATAVVRSRPKP